MNRPLLLIKTSTAEHASKLLEVAGLVFGIAARAAGPNAKTGNGDRFIYPKFHSDLLSIIIAPCAHSVRKEVTCHKYICCKIHNAIPANPDKRRKPHNARCNCLERHHSNKMNTNILRRIPNNCNHQVESSTALLHSRMAARIFLPTAHLKDFYVLQCVESHKLKALGYPHHSAD